jgi:hypothetical protein
VPAAAPLALPGNSVAGKVTGAAGEACHLNLNIVFCSPKIDVIVSGKELVVLAGLYFALNWAG